MEPMNPRQFDGYARLKIPGAPSFNRSVSLALWDTRTPYSSKTAVILNKGVVLPEAVIWTRSHRFDHASAVRLYHTPTLSLFP